jgi:DNA recombination protein RmuC
MAETKTTADASTASKLSLSDNGILLGGAAVLGFCAGFALRGRALSLQKVASATEQRQLIDIQSSLRRLEQGVPETESRIGNKLQTQEKNFAMYGQSMSSMITKVDDLRTVFHSPRLRGVFGELQLETLVRDVMHPGSFAFQSTLSNGTRPDCLIKLPLPIGTICIDAKLPLDAFRELCTAQNNCNEMNNNNSNSNNSNSNNTNSNDVVMARRKMTKHLQEHIRQIADKYIIPGETADSALLFLPSEAVFAEVVEHHDSVIRDAYKRRVWISSPTTLMAVLTTMRCTIRDITLSHQTDIILKEVLAMKDDIDRLEKRNEAVEKSFEKAQHSLRQMRISTDKIGHRRNRISMLTEHDISAMLGSDADAITDTDGESLSLDKQDREGDENIHIPTSQRTVNGSSI